MALPTTVKVSNKTKQRLNQLKYRKQLKTINDAIEHLLDEHGEEKLAERPNQNPPAERLPPQRT